MLSVIAPLEDRVAFEIADDMAELGEKIPVGLGGYEAEKRRELFESRGLRCFKGVEEVLEWEDLF